MGQMGCPETSVTTDLRCITSQKDDLIYVVVEAWNYETFLIFACNIISFYVEKFPADEQW